MLAGAMGGCLVLPVARAGPQRAGADAELPQALNASYGRAGAHADLVAIELRHAAAETNSHPQQKT
jgi:hypothetical protein